MENIGEQLTNVAGLYRPPVVETTDERRDFLRVRLFDLTPRFRPS